MFDTPRVKTAKQIFALVFFGAILAAFVWLMGVPAARLLIRQYRAESFPKTEGHVVSVRITSRTGSKGKIYYQPAFSYAYEVDGQSYRGHAYRYEANPSDQASVNQIVAAHPVDSTINVYYDPNNPADALLAPLVSAEDVSPFFLSMFVVLIISFFWLKDGYRSDWLPGAKSAAGGMKISVEMLTTRVQLPRFQPFWLGLTGSGILSVVTGVLTDTVLKSSGMPAGLLTLIITLIIGGGALVYFWHYRKIASGVQDLVINEATRTVELPLTYKRRERRQVPFSEITSVALVEVPHQGRYSVSYSYAPTLELRDGSSERLTDLSEARAESFAAWLCEKLGIPPPTTLL